MFPKRIRVRPSPAASMMGGVVGLIFVVLGFFVISPKFGLFGVAWTVVAVVLTLSSFYNAFSRTGIATEIITSDESEYPEGRGSIEDRLRSLEDLQEKGMITTAEYQQRRAEILREI